MAFGEHAETRAALRLARERGCLTRRRRARRRRVGARPAGRRGSVHRAGARRDAVPRAVGARARVLRAPRAARGTQRADRARQRRVELPLPVSRRSGRTTSSQSSPTYAHRCSRRPPRWPSCERRRSSDGEQELRDAAARAARVSGRAVGVCWRWATAARRPTRWMQSPTCASRRADWPVHAAIDLTEDPGILTAIANDVGEESIFARQVIAHGAHEDALLAFSTSGGSRNVLAALAEARRRGLMTIAFVGYDGGRIAAEALAEHVIVSARSTFRGSRRRRRAPGTCCASSWRARREPHPGALRGGCSGRGPGAGACRGNRAGGRLSPLRVSPGRRAWARAGGCATTSAASSSRSRARRRRSRRSWRGLSSAAPAAGAGRARSCRAASRYEESAAL